MKIKTKKRLAATAATAALAAGLVVAGGATGAFAIDRISCNSSEYLHLYSDNTTCWQNAGGQDVVLNNVNSAAGGNNDGYVY